MNPRARAEPAARSERRSPPSSAPPACARGPRAAGSARAGAAATPSRQRKRSPAPRPPRPPGRSRQELRAERRGRRRGARGPGQGSARRAQPGRHRSPALPLATLSRTAIGWRGHVGGVRAPFFTPIGFCRRVGSERSPRLPRVLIGCPGAVGERRLLRADWSDCDPADPLSRRPRRAPSPQRCAAPRRAAAAGPRVPRARRRSGARLRSVLPLEAACLPRPLSRPPPAAAAALSPPRGAGARGPQAAPCKAPNVPSV